MPGEYEKAITIQITLAMMLVSITLPIEASKTETIIHVYPGTLIQDAIDSASDGDIVYVHNGIYHECNILISNKISLIGEDRDLTIIDGDNEYADVIKILADYVTVCKFTIKNSNGNGIHIISEFQQLSSIVLIGDNKIVDVSVGLKIEDVNGVFINGNVIEHKSAGIVLIQSSGNVIQGNDIDGENMGASGIVLLRSNNNIINFNTISHNNDYGIYIPGLYQWNFGNRINCNNFIENNGEILCNNCRDKFLEELTIGGSQ